MLDTSNLPDVGAQLRPLVESVPPEIRPRLVAQLERVAGERYQAWAADCPNAVQAAGLRECAARENEVARRVEALFPSRPDEGRHFATAVPKVVEAYRIAMAERPVREQWAIQAAAERSGAAFWRTVAASVPDGSMRKELEGCAELEELSAVFLERAIA
jgi:hypothetical protein